MSMWCTVNSGGFGEFGESLLVGQTFFAQTFNFFVSVMASEEIHQILLSKTYS